MRLLNIINCLKSLNFVYKYMRSWLKMVFLYTVRLSPLVIVEKRERYK